MKRKLILHPAAYIVIAFGLMIVIAFSVRSCINNNDEVSQMNELLEYHSETGSLVVEVDGYVRIVKQ